jgi:hypothetical protein
VQLPQIAVVEQPARHIRGDLACAVLIKLMPGRELEPIVGTRQRSLEAGVDQIAGIHNHNAGSAMAHKVSTLDRPIMWCPQHRVFRPPITPPKLPGAVFPMVGSLGSVTFDEAGPKKRSAGRKQVSVEHFRLRADECRRLASGSRTASDKAFWLNLVERWQALETQKRHQPVRGKSRSPLRRQPELAVED